MKYEKYTIRASESFREYTFHSHGRKGSVTKKISFDALDGLPGVYNLSFGDLDENGDVDDIVVTDNGDSEKVLATVAFAIGTFFEVYPDAWIWIVGSTEARIRLYRMAVSKNLKELENNFYIFGRVKKKWRRFESDRNYDALIVRLKKPYLYKA